MYAVCVRTMATATIALGTAFILSYAIKKGSGDLGLAHKLIATPATGKPHSELIVLAACTTYGGGILKGACSAHVDSTTSCWCTHRNWAIQKLGYITWSTNREKVRKHPSKTWSVCVSCTSAAGQMWQILYLCLEMP